MGSVRSPLNWHGGKSHGPVPRDLSIDMNRKMWLLSIKTVLSAKLYEEKLIFMNTAEIPTHKTKFLNSAIEGFGHKWVLFVVPHNVNENFTRAIGNIHNRDYIHPQ